jgi:hypothetical protein
MMNQPATNFNLKKENKILQNNQIKPLERLNVCSNYSLITPISNSKNINHKICQPSIVQPSSQLNFIPNSYYPQCSMYIPMYALQSTRGGLIYYSIPHIFNKN